MKLTNKLRTGILATTLTGLIGCALAPEGKEYTYTDPNEVRRVKQIQGPKWTHKPIEFYDETQIILSGNFKLGDFSIYEDGVQWEADRGNYWFSIPYENIQHTQVAKDRYFFGLRKFNNLIIQSNLGKWKSIRFVNADATDVKQKVDEIHENYLSNKTN